MSSSTGGAETDGAAAILAQKKVVEDARRDVENAKAAYERGKEELQRTKKERSYFAYLRGGKQSIFNMGVAFVLLALATRGLAEKVSLVYIDCRSARGCLSLNLSLGHDSEFVLAGIDSRNDA